jgi:hypothetical protein
MRCMGTTSRGGGGDSLNDTPVPFYGLAGRKP